MSCVRRALKGARRVSMMTRRWTTPIRSAPVVGLCVLWANTAAAQWTQLGGSPSRVAIARSAAPSLSAPVWTCSRENEQFSIEFVPEGGLAASPDAVFAVGHRHPIGPLIDEPRLFAVSRVDGHVIWSSLIDEPYNQSISAPAVDMLRGTVIVASGGSTSVGGTVRAFHLNDGSPAWQTQLTRAVVNASPLVTTDRPGQDRVFITDFGGSAGLYCINASPFDTQLNPYQPGDIVWRAPVGRASGATPAYAPSPDGGRVYLATYGPNQGAGQVLCFPAGALAAPAAIWARTNVIDQGFFGGVCVRALAKGSAVYAASYAFYGGPTAANMLRLDADTGAVTWSVPTNRTDSIPVPLDDGRVFLAGGIAGEFGTERSLALFNDLGDSAAPVWDSGDQLDAGGRVIQPIAVETPFGLRVLCAAGGADDDLAFSPDLYLVDPSRPPTDPAFVADHAPDVGGGAIITEGNVYAVGPTGLLAFGPAPAHADVNDDGATNLADIYSWEQGVGQLDVNRDGVVDDTDRLGLLTAIRAFEPSDLSGGRP